MTGFNLSTKIAFLLLSTNIVAIIVTGLIYHERHQSQFIETVEKHLESVAQQELLNVENLLEYHQGYLQILANQVNITLEPYLNQHGFPENLTSANKLKHPAVLSITEAARLSLTSFSQIA